MPFNNRYRVLSLDGGGSWALIEVKALLNIYGDVPGHEVLSKFDLVAANSGGSIVAGALATNKLLSDILKLFADPATNCRKQLFVALPIWDEVGRVFGIGPKYDAAKKLPGLRGVLNSGPVAVGNVPMVELPDTLHLPTQFLITAFDYDACRARFFRSDTGSQASTLTVPDRTVDLASAIHASSNAPVNYFDAPALFGGGQFWDGGVAGYNNPVLAGVLELLAKGVARSQIDVLSLGTANVALPVAGTHPAADPSLVQGPRRAGFPRVLTDIPLLAASIVDDPPDAATFHTHLALCQSIPPDIDHPVTDGPVVRMNPLVRPVLDATSTWIAPQFAGGATAAQNLADFQALVKLGMDAVEDDQVALIGKLAEAWLAGAVRNQPIRWRGGEDVGCEIGQDSFAAAKATWLAHSPPGVAYSSP